MGPPLDASFDRAVTVRAGLAIAALFASALLVIAAASRSGVLVDGVARTAVLLSTVLLVSDLVLLQRARRERARSLFARTAVLEALVLGTWLAVTDPATGPLVVVGPAFVLAHRLAPIPHRTAARAMVVAHTLAFVLALGGLPQLVAGHRPGIAASVGPFLALATIYTLAFRAVKVPPVTLGPGTDLATRVRREGALSLDEVLRVTRSLVAALAEVHAQGSVHRAIDPSKVWLATDGRCVLLGREEGEDLQALGSGRDPGYLAPEQVSASVGLVGPKADQFALAVVLHFALTGTPPFASSQAAAVIHRILTETPPPPSSLVDGIPEDVDLALAIALAKEPGDRYSTIDDLGRALGAAARGELDDAHREHALALGRPQGSATSTVTVD
jgi:hypothetical protein